MSLLSQGIILLGSAVVAVPLLKRFGLASVLGYLAAGILIGPWGLKLIGDPQAILHVTEFGVVLLMFVIGLELQPSRLWVLRRSVFGLGGAQMLCTSTLLGGLAWLAGFGWQAALIAGLALSLSSTAFVLQMLAEKQELTSRHGREAFAILLFQDLAVIPILALLPLLAPQLAGNKPSVWLSLGVLVAVLLAGRSLLNLAFRRIARAGSHEIFSMATLLTVMAIAWLLDWAGLSMSLGAFLAGVLLADSDYRHELEAHIEPFKGLLLGLFFVAVGMAANLGVLLAKPVQVLGLACGLLLVKGLVLFAVGKLSGLDACASRRLAVYLGQGGEFAFLLFAVASGNGLLDQASADLLAITVTLSMALTPFWASLHERWLAPKGERRQPEFDQINDESHRVIVAGFGRFGQIVARLLRLKKIGVTVLEVNPEQVDFVRRFGNRIHYGDASRLDLLRAAGAERAEVFVLAIDDVEMSLKTANVVRRHFPQLKIYARARNRFHYYKLRDLGVEVISRETFLSSLDLGRQLLEELGIPAEQAQQDVRTFQTRDEAMLERQYAVHQDEASLIQTTQQAVKELEDLFEQDNAPAQKAI